MMAPIGLAEMQDASAGDPIAVSVLAAAKARAWCAEWGGCSDPVEMMQQVYVCRPAARRELEAIMAMPLQDRQALARAITASRAGKRGDEG